MRERNHSLYEHLYQALEIKKMSNICDFVRILKTECNLEHFTRNCRIQNLDDFERDEADVYFWRAGLLNVKKKRNDHMIHYEQVFGNVFEKGKQMLCSIHEALSQS